MTYGDYLAPVLVKSAKEQDKFAVVFPRLAPWLGLDFPTNSEPVIAKPSKTTLLPPRKRHYRWVGALLAMLLAGCAYFGYFLLNPIVKGCMDETSVNYNPNANRDDGSCSYLPPDSTIVGCLDPASINFNPDATKGCEDCCNYTGCMDSLALNFNVKAKIPCEGCCEYNARSEQNLSSVASLVETDSTVFLVPFGKQELTKPQLIAIDREWTFLVYQSKDLLVWILSGILMAFILSVLLFNRAQRGFAARRERGEEPPYLLPIKVSDHQGIRFREGLSPVLNRFRSRESSQRQLLDIKKTINATIKKGGGLDFKFRHYSAPTEYLLLIDKPAEQDHQSHLANQFYAQLQRSEIYAERYYYDGNPAICWNEAYPTGIRLERLMQKHYGARLLVFADGHSFINPVAISLEPWLQKMDVWSKRALVTNTPTMDWGYRERLLADFFYILPNNLDGLRTLEDHFAEGKPTNLAKWKYKYGQADQVIELSEDQLPQSMRSYFPVPMCKWIAACAVYPELHWDLTVALGRVIEKGQSHQLVTYERVRQLSQLEWFRKGEIPGAARERLMGLLSNQEKQQVRKALLRILEQNVPQNQSSFAFEEHQLHLAVNKLLVEKMPAERKKWIEVYRNQYEKGLPEDFVAIRELDQQFNKVLDFKLPNTYWKLFYRDGRKLLGERRLVIPVVGLILIGLLFFGNWLWKVPCFERSNLVYIPGEDARTCVFSVEDSVNYFTLKALYHIDRSEMDSMGKVERFMFAHDRSAEFRERVDDVFQPAIARAYFNKARDHYNAKNFQNSQLFLQKLFESFQENQIENGNFRGNALQMLGLCYFYQGDYEKANSFSAVIEERSNYMEETGVPNLTHFTRYDFVDSMVMGHIRIRKEGKYGFLDQKGAETWATKDGLPPFDHAFNYTEDSTALVMDKNLQCFIDWNGLRHAANCFAKLIPFKDSATQKWGYENGNGIIVIEPIYDQVSSFGEEGLAIVQANGQFGFVRKNGQLLNAGLVFDGADAFSEGLANIRKGGKWGYLKADGKLAIPYRFDVAEPFGKGTARVELNDVGFYIDTNGDCVSGNNCPRTSFIITVLDATTKEPITGAVISHENRVFKTTETNSQGMATLDIFEHELPRFPTFKVEAEAYNSLFVRVPLQYGKNIDPILMVPSGQVIEDRDGDGIANTEDACPDAAGPRSTFGCPDSDKDGVMDREDKCPTEKGSKSNGGCPKTLTEKTAQKPSRQRVQLNEIDGTQSEFKAKDGQVYLAISYAGQTWLAENLSIDIPGATCYEDQVNYCSSLGRLYPWEAAIEACQELGMGWRLPSVKDWEDLATRFGGRGNPAFLGLTNENNGFAAKLGGYRTTDGDYVYLNTYGYFWTSDRYGKESAWYYNLGKATERLDRYYNQRTYGYSVRCIKD